MKKMLFLDACISTHESRTKRLCDVYLEEFLKTNEDAAVETVELRSGFFQPLTKERIQERDGFVVSKDWSDPMFDLAKQFREADCILLGTPYWDLSFASIVKVYIENIVVADLTFASTESGFQGLCNGKMLTYITTAGGYIGAKNFGYDYMVGMAQMLGVDETQFFAAEGLDIAGNNPDAIMDKAVADMKSKLR